MLSPLQRYYAQRCFNGGMGTLLDFGEEETEDAAAEAAAHWIIENSSRGSAFRRLNEHLYGIEDAIGLS